MFKIRAKLQAPSFNYTIYVTQLESRARDLLSRAMLEYITTFQQIVPVWSGASHATLTRLAQLISAPLAITPSPTSFFDGKGYGSSRGDAYYDDSGGEYVFTFETNLPHLVYNEFNDANSNPDPGLRGKLLQPGPYNFIGQTNQAVRVVLRQFVPPDLNTMITKKRVR